MLFINFISK